LVSLPGVVDSASGRQHRLYGPRAYTPTEPTRHQPCRSRRPLGSLVPEVGLTALAVVGTAPLPPENVAGTGRAPLGRTSARELNLVNPLGRARLASRSCYHCPRGFRHGSAPGRPCELLARSADDRHLRRHPTRLRRVGMLIALPLAPSDPVARTTERLPTTTPHAQRRRTRTKNPNHTQYNSRSAPADGIHSLQATTLTSLPFPLLYPSCPRPHGGTQSRERPARRLSARTSCRRGKGSWLGNQTSRFRGFGCTTTIAGEKPSPLVSVRPVPRPGSLPGVHVG
jgi:hypothetical protein